ncbi:uncharacterized protein LOC126379964 [Pectinophora gossypiella]|uniref:uncharacterized protein LOC126379964 n=1 Tax=Pectinophora gossypiella TaxID=13191 RepID=UPI00214E3D29|nr:uncharacterized protein LOC126379964 [Pectinophora gossypiella]
MSLPMVDKLFGILPLKYGCFLVSVGGIGAGAFGLTGVILYGLVEESFLSVVDEHDTADGGLKKVVLCAFGLNSILLIVSNVPLFFGIIVKSHGMTNFSQVVMFMMVILNIVVFVALPTSCLLLSDCLVKAISSTVLLVGVVAMYVYLSLWLYFAVCVWNLSLEY